MDTQESKSIYASFCCENVGGRMRNAVRIHKRDNVAVVVEPISEDELCVCTDAQGVEQGVAIRKCTPVYHRLALSGIHKGEPATRHGEWVRIVACDIKQGMHVHVHNIWNTRR